MLHLAVIYSGLFLIVTSTLLFLVGHRFRLRHWAWSQLFIALTGGASWFLQRALTGEALPLVASMTGVLLVGSVITAWCEDWNPPAHANLAAVTLTVTSFFSYATFVLVEAHLGPASLIFGGILLILQAGVLVLLVAHTFEILDVVCRTRWHRHFDPKVVPGYCPTVSIHVPTHNEPPELVIETLNALAALDYPHYEVLVIDNNTVDESLWEPVRKHCETLGARFRFFHLLPWLGFKSGALNFALDQVAADTEIIGIVDADHLVEPNYLKDLVGHFADSQVAFVQTPQDYRDCADRGRYGRALYLSYRYFFAVSMHSRNERNAIIFAGTMGLIRRDALNQVGRWDEWCITEDAEVSLRLLNAGYQSVYVDRTYGRGLMPLDYAALKKQRFRWAFGGMQLLRMHARSLLIGRAAGRLTAAQRFAYLSGGLQWLNDPMTVAFTMILLIASGALIGGGSLYLQPLVGATILIPPLLLLFGVMRFLWAFRVRVGCRWRDAFDAFIMLLGLTWIVTLACLRGLTARHGVFLRTPKQSERPRLREIAQVVWFEGLLATVSLVACGMVLVGQPLQPFSARSTFVLLLGWQFLIYASAARSGIWSYRAYSPSAAIVDRFSVSRISGYFGRSISEWRMASAVALSATGLAVLFRIAVLSAPSLERVWRTDPLDEFVAARTLVPPQPSETVGAQLIREADAARRQDVAAALGLWDSQGVIKDAMFTPDVPDDDRIWIGFDGIRARYEQEFRLRHYRELRHLNLSVTFHGADEATIINDLDALIESNEEAARVQLDKSDRWTLRRHNGHWRIVMLEVNRVVRPSAGPTAARLIGESKP
jgi:cellulose synthase/poly-beta-1,6-N-acetylglucosamine synthase-like glycosyltransferase